MVTGTMGRGGTGSIVGVGAPLPLSPGPAGAAPPPRQPPPAGATAPPPGGRHPLLLAAAGAAAAGGLSEPGWGLRGQGLAGDTPLALPPPCLYLKGETEARGGGIN